MQRRAEQQWQQIAAKQLSLKTPVSFAAQGFQRKGWILGLEGADWEVEVSCSIQIMTQMTMLNGANKISLEEFVAEAVQKAFKSGCMKM